MSVVYITVGNSDGKLSHREWADLVQQIDQLLHPGTGWTTVIHGAWHSRPAAPHQNACWCVQFRDPDTAESIKRVLSWAARDFRQDSIVWAAVEPEFIRPPGATNTASDGAAIPVEPTGCRHHHQRCEVPTALCLVDCLTATPPETAGGGQDG